jgi:hypothetical protein
MKQINIIHLHMPQTNIHYSFEMPQTLNYSFAHATDFDTEIHLYSFIYILKCLGQSLLISLWRRRTPYIHCIHLFDRSISTHFIHLFD